MGTGAAMIVAVDVEQDEPAELGLQVTQHLAQHGIIGVMQAERAFDSDVIGRRGPDAEAPGLLGRQVNGPVAGAIEIDLEARAVKDHAIGHVPDDKFGKGVLFPAAARRIERHVVGKIGANPVAVMDGRAYQRRSCPMDGPESIFLGGMTKIRLRQSKWQ